MCTSNITCTEKNWNPSQINVCDIFSAVWDVFTISLMLFLDILRVVLQTQAQRTQAFFVWADSINPQFLFNPEVSGTMNVAVCVPIKGDLKNKERIV